MKGLLLLLFIQALGNQVPAVGKIRMETTGSASFLDADYTTTGGEVTITDLTGAGETLEISENRTKYHADHIPVAHPCPSISLYNSWSWSHRKIPPTWC